jgi:tetratricopeptide (TPR) repeat protein
MAKRRPRADDGAFHRATRLTERLLRRSGWLYARDLRSACKMARLATWAARGASRRPGADIGLALLLEARSYARRADLSWRRGNLRRADEEARRARSIYGDPRVAPHVTDHETRLAMTEAWIAHSQGNSAAALAMVIDAAAFFRDIARDMEGYVKALGTLASIRIQMQDYREATPTLVEAVRIGKTVADHATFGSFVHNVAVCASKTGDPEAAACFAEGCAILERNGAHEHLRIARLHMAELHRMDGRPDEALAVYHDVRAEYLQREEHENAARVAVDIISVLVEQSRYPEALLLGRRALELLVAGGWNRDGERLRELLRQCGVTPAC